MPEFVITKISHKTSKVFVQQHFFSFCLFVFVVFFFFYFTFGLGWFWFVLFGVFFGNKAAQGL